jgi:hypothetical protein
VKSANPAPRRASRYPAKIEKIGNRVRICGERGKWNVGMHAQLAGRNNVCFCAARLSSDPGAFEPIPLRDDARELRNNIQYVLAARPAQPVFLSVYAPHTTDRERSFPNPDYVVVSFRSAEFDFIWRPPRDVTELVQRRGGE